MWDIYVGYLNVWELGAMAHYDQTNPVLHINNYSLWDADLSLLCEVF